MTTPSTASRRLRAQWQRANVLRDSWDIMHTCGPTQENADRLCPTRWDPPQDDWFNAGLHLIAASLALDGLSIRAVTQAERSLGRRR